MSTMRADLLQNRAGTSHPAVTKADFVKAWATGNNTGTASLHDSFSVSSITDTAVGQLTVNYAVTFTQTFHPVNITANNAHGYLNSIAATSVRSSVSDPANVLADTNYIAFSSKGNLA